ncbi:hypothetical protein Poli38472_008768 [Pythium oligandrum]|uniref:WRKY19-like zinc finger domain-containing protein n=1 Tax=Pythium oligandrum TaxID=41045 RepID=A0A8K1C488_PYTOL|nr:hypothetical protein Poli38472_008768 [Pythium oligandrum]|eukprot:TMW56120.1 hypothetical protein Poli38472_008768 [Pythium oligandrum]
MSGSPLFTSSMTPSGSMKRHRKHCSFSGCEKVDAGGGYCVAHGGGKKCSFPGCKKGYQTGGFCRQHGGGARCQVDGCGKVDAGKGFCRAHGGGRRCQTSGCKKADVGGGFCTTHGGGRRCSEPGCSKIDQGGGKCRAHGGARRCRETGCLKPARGSNGLCSEHGGARLCSVPNCRRIARANDGTLCGVCAKEKVKAEQESTVNVYVMTSQLGNEYGEGLMLRPMEQLVHFAQRLSDASSHMDEIMSSAGELPPVQGGSCFPSSVAEEVLDQEMVVPAEEPGPPSAAYVASCLQNGCSRSFGGRCNCKAGCSCCRKSKEDSTDDTTTAANDGSDEASTPVSPLKLQRFVVVVQPSSFPVETLLALLRSLPGVRSVHLPLQASADESVDEPTTIILRCDPLVDAETALNDTIAALRIEYQVSETTTIDWVNKEIVLKVEEMMCPGNCGRTVINALRVVPNVQTANLMFETRCVAARGGMGAKELCDAVDATGFEPVVVAETALPQRFRFRVNDFVSLHVHGLRLKYRLMNVEGVETVLVMVERAEVLVEATLTDAAPLLRAALAHGHVMVEIAETGIAPSPFDPAVATSKATTSSAPAPITDDNDEDHVCDVMLCPQNGCQKYMATVAHTAALAVGWVVPGCAMSWGGECTCGEKCKCNGCPQHNPAS